MSRSTSTGSINLLPASIQTRLQTRDALQLWIRILASSGAICAMAIAIGQFLAMGLNREIVATQSQTTAPQQLLNENVRLRARVRSLTSSAGRRQQERNQYSPLVVLELVSSIRDQVDGALEIESFTFHEKDVATDKKSIAKEVASVVLKMKTKGVANSAKIVSAIRDSNRFSRVELASALEQIGGTKNGLRFSVRCSL
ncbi:MAG: hypothetical protein AB8B50_16045 [Pirellulaceae bacterium]